jgi:EAL domain-containing protein (putative c-di-GMP-specific phosphodiesterase class I)
MPSPSAVDPKVALQTSRVRLMLYIGSLLLVGLGIGWAAYFAYLQKWAIVALDTLIVLVGFSVFGLTRRQRMRRAFYILLGTIFWVICGIAALLDIPSAAAPRSIHLFLLVLAVCALLFMQGERGPLRYVVAGVCFAAFIVFASTNAAWIPGYALPDSVRVGGTWLNAILSIVTIYALVHIMMSEIANVSSLEMDLRKGIARSEFFLVYQPQVTADGRVTGAEALLRWQHPARGLVSPAEFIVLAEQTGLILPLGLQVLEMGCKELATWASRPGMSDLTLSLNVSAQQFRQDDFVQQVHSVLEAKGIRPHRLKVELTESLLVHDLEDIVSKMDALKQLGVGFSLDDFGTGYSSLSYLKRLPLDQLKIDQSFVRDILTDANDGAIARTVISLGQSLNFAVIAEGVETAGQRDFLVDNGCNLFQGYLFSKPLPAQGFVDYVQTSLSDEQPN